MALKFPKSREPQRLILQLILYKAYTMAACPAKLSKQGRIQGEGCQGDYQTLEMSCGDEETCQSDNQGNHL